MLVNESRILDGEDSDDRDDLDALQSSRTHFKDAFKAFTRFFLFSFPLFPDTSTIVSLEPTKHEQKKKKEKRIRETESVERIDANQSFFFGRQLIVHSPLPIRFNDYVQHVADAHTSQTKCRSSFSSFQRAINAR